MMAPSGAVAVFTVVLISSTISQEIVKTPSDVTVFLNQTAVFTCEVHGAFFYQYWRVDGTHFNSLSSDIRDDLDTDQERVGDNEEFFLTILGRAQYNGITVQCVVGGGGGELESENATLNIQGRLSSVRNLRTETSSIIILWGPPFSLNVTDVDPDIWYSILIYNVTDEDHSTVVPCTDCTNITETLYNFTPDHLSSCHKYTFTVIPYNGAGQGESSQNVSAVSRGEPSVQFTNIGIQAMDSSQCNVTFLVSGVIESVCKYTLHVVDVMDGAIFMPRTTALEDGGFISYLLPANGRYSTAFEVENAAGVMIAEINNFTTFDIQNSSANEFGGRITVKGEFITDSFAVGCFIVLQCNETTVDVYRAIPRNGSEQTVSETIDVPPANYTVYAYDIENNGLPYTLPANEPGNENLTINTNYSQLTPTSTILNRANISVTGSQVAVDCEFADGCPLTSCVLIYREYNNPTLTVIDYSPTTTVFPVTLTVDQPEKFTFAIFGRNCEGELEEKPAKTLKLNAVTTPSDDPSPADVGTLVAGVASVVVLVTAMMSLTVIVVLLMMKKFGVHRSSKCRPDYGREISNVMLLEEKKRKIKSDSGTPNGAVEEESGTAMTVAEYASFNIAPSEVQPQPSVDQRVQYQEIDSKKTKRAAHPHGLHYSDVHVVPPPPDSEGRNRIVVDSTPRSYATILPHTDIPLSDEKMSVKKAIPPPVGNKPQGPPTVEAVIDLLWSVAGLWKVIAEGLGFDDDIIDEIFTNNETEEACLQDCVEQWMRLGPTWQKLAHVLSDMGQNILAQQAWSGESCLQRPGMSSQLSASTRTTSDGFPSGSEDSGGNKSSEFVGDGYGQVENTSEQDESRGTQIPMSEEQQGSGLQDNAILQEEEVNDDITDAITCVSEEENGNTDSEPSTTAECTSDEDDIVILPPSDLPCHISKLLDIVRSGSCCFESPLQDGHKNVNVNLEKDDNTTNEFFLTLCCPLMNDDIKDELAVLQFNAKLEEDSKVSDRKVHSDAGPVAVLPLPCTSFPTADDSPPRAEKSGAVFNYSPELTQNGSIQSTETFQHRKKLIASSFYTDLGKGASMVTGDVYTRVGMFYDCTTSSTATEICPPPESEDAHIQQPPTATLPQQQQPKKKPPQAPGGSLGQNAKLIPPFKKRQWSDPPDNYQEKMERWTHTGVALGFHGPGLQAASGRNSHYG